MKILLTIMFFIAVSLTAYFIGSLSAWMAYKINPKEFKEEFTNKDTLYANVAMVIAIILWSIIFYNLISKL